MNEQVYNSSVVENLWNRLPSGGFAPIEGGENPVKLVKGLDDRVGLVFSFPQSVRMGELNSQGFIAELKEVGDKKELQVLKNKDSELDIFSSLVANLLDLFYQIRKESSKNRFNLIVSRIKAWQKFMAVRIKKLDKKEQLGLFGELKILEFILANGLRESGICELWAGPLRGSHDFKINEKELLEVKSSLTETPFEIRVDSLLQLDFAPGENLYVAAVFCSNHEDGENLRELASKIKENLPSNVDVVEFESLLMAAGLNPGENEEGMFKFICRKISFFKASELPRIIPTTVPGIISASYKIALTSASGGNWTKPLSSEEYLKLLKERESNAFA